MIEADKALDTQADFLRAFLAYHEIGKTELAEEAGYSPAAVSGLLNKNPARLNQKGLTALTDAFMRLLNRKKGTSTWRAMLVLNLESTNTLKELQADVNVIEKQS